MKSNCDCCPLTSHFRQIVHLGHFLKYCWTGSVSDCAEWSGDSSKKKVGIRTFDNELVVLVEPPLESCVIHVGEAV